MEHTPTLCDCVRVCHAMSGCALLSVLSLAGWLDPLSEMGDMNGSLQWFPILDLLEPVSRGSVVWDPPTLMLPACGVQDAARNLVAGCHVHVPYYGRCHTGPRIHWYPRVDVTVADRTTGITPFEPSLSHLNPLDEVY